ncbi:MAG: recombination factor protein RarA, partial [Polyangiales bacterium]
RGWKAAQAAVRQHGSQPVPLHLRNAPTGLAKALGHGAGYIHAHDDPEAAAQTSGLPEALRGQRFYQPNAVGLELQIAERLKRLRGA